MDFSLPASTLRPRPTKLAIVTALAALACLAMLVIQRVAPPRPRGDGVASDASGESAGAATELVRLAEELERRSLYDQAAGVWGEVAGARGAASAEILYRQGKNFALAGRHREAARALTHVDMLSDADESLKRKAASLLLDSLSALGKEDVRRFVLEKSTLRSADPSDAARATVVARIGGEPITLDDLRGVLEAQAVAELETVEVIPTAAELRARAKSIVAEEMEHPERVRALLQQLIQTEVFRREALALGLGSDDEYQRALDLFRGAYLSRRLVRAKLGAALGSLSETDLRNHFAANPERFVERAGTEFSYRRFATETEAAAAAGDRSGDGYTRADGVAASGEPLPALGRSPEATAHLLALDAGDYGGRPIRIGDAWYLFRADGKREERERSFEEAKDDVARDLAIAKQDEAAQRLQAELTAKYWIEVLDEEIDRALGAAQSEDATDSGEATRSGGGADDASAAPDDTSGGR